MLTTRAFWISIWSVLPRLNASAENMSYFSSPSFSCSGAAVWEGGTILGRMRGSMPLSKCTAHSKSIKAIRKSNVLWKGMMSASNSPLLPIPIGRLLLWLNRMFPVWMSLLSNLARGKEPMLMDDMWRYVPHVQSDFRAWRRHPPRYSIQRMIK